MTRLIRPSRGCFPTLRFEESPTLDLSVEMIYFPDRCHRSGGDAAAPSFENRRQLFTLLVPVGGFRRRFLLNPVLSRRTRPTFQHSLIHRESDATLRDPIPQPASSFLVFDLSLFILFCFSLTAVFRL